MRHSPVYASLACALGLGLALTLLWLLGGGYMARAANLPRPAQAPGDVYCVAPISATYSSCTAVFTNVQAAVDAATRGEIIKVATGVYTGVQSRDGVTQAVYISKTLTVRGGYTTTDWVNSYPLTQPTTLDAQGQGRVLYIIGDISPTIESLRITGGSATGLGGGIFGIDAGGGVYIITATATLSNNHIVSNTASTIFYGLGGGVFLESSASTLFGNAIVSNTASTANIGAGGGVGLLYSASALSSNTIAGNTASTANIGLGGGVLLTYSTAVLVGNTIISNTATLSTATIGYGGGMLVYGSNPFTLTNNLVAGNQANTNGSGLWISNSQSSRLLYTTIANNTGSGDGVYVTGTTTLALTNTILSGHTVGISVTDGSTATLQATLWYDNGIDTSGTGSIFTGTINVYGDPAFANPSAGDYHLTLASAAIDAGVDDGVTTDLDGRPRPAGKGYDIGAFEYQAAMEVSKQADPEPVVAGTQLTYTIRITNTGNVTLSNMTLSDTLPLSVTLTTLDQTNDGYGDWRVQDGAHQNTYWHDIRPGTAQDDWLTLVNPTSGTGVYTSHVLDAGNIVTWTTMTWTPRRPYWKELPNYRQVETNYNMGNADMRGNRVLLHLNSISLTTAMSGTLILTTSGTVSDTSGLGNLGTCPATPDESCPTAIADGRLNGALHFDGALSQTIVVTDTFNPVRYALELWVRPQVITDTSFILRTDTLSGTTAHYSHLLGISSGRFLHALNDSSGSLRAITSTTAVTPNTWYHVVGTAESGGDMKLYVNGDLDAAPLSGLGQLWTGGDQYRLGSAYGPTGTTQYLTGDLDEVAVYSRTLSGGEALDHYLRGALRVSFQTRSCDEAACNGEAFVGPGGLTTTVYSELSNTSVSLPSVTLAGLSNNRHFQYRATLETDNGNYAPELRSVRVWPDHRRVIASQGSCTELVGNAFVCDLNSLATGEAITVTAHVYVNASALNIITNTAIVTATTPDADVLSSTAIATTTVTAQANLSINKWDEAVPNWVNPGYVITYHLDIYNGGPSTAISPTITDTLPGDMIGFAWGTGWSCNSGNAITCTRPSLGPYQWTAIHITATAPITEGWITNTVWITSPLTPDPNLNNNDDDATTLVAPLANLLITKTADPDPVDPGQTLTYTIIITNHGPYTATGVIVTDTLPTGFMGYAIASSDWLCHPPSGVMACLLTTPITPAQSASFYITVTAPLSGFLANVAEATSAILDPDDTNNVVVTYAAVRRVADLSIAKSDTPDPVSANTPLTYTITITNAGPVSAGALANTLAFTNSHHIDIPWVGRATLYPSNINISSVEGNIQNLTVTLNGLTHSYPGDLSILLVGPDGQSVVLMSNAVGGADASDVMLRFNNAGVSLPLSDTITSTTVYRPTNYGITGDLPVPAPPGPYGGSLPTGGLRLSAFSGASPNGLWQLFVYDSMDSDGGDIAAGWSLELTTVTTDTVTLTDELPSSLTNVTVSAAPGWNCAGSGPVTCSTLVFPVNIPAVFTINATAPITGSVITNTAEITSTTADYGPGLNTATITTTVLAQADLQIAKSASPEPVGAGQLLTYTITFTNAGPSPVTNVTITDTLPTSAILDSAPGCSVMGNVLTCDVASPGVNIPGNLVITVLAPPDPGVITNTAGITSTALEPHLLDNTAWVTTTVTPIADLSLGKTDTPDPVTPGKTLTYTIVITNNGPSVATNVTLTDSVPASTTFQSLASPPGWNCTTPAVGGSGNIVCTHPSLTAGASATFAIAVAVDANVPTGAIITNTATVSSDAFDPTTPNTASTTTALTPVADLSIGKTASPSSVFAGHNIFYTVVVTNNGPDAAVNVILTDSVPASTTFQSLTPPSGWNCATPAVGGGGNIVCTHPSLAAGASATFAIAVTVDSSAPTGAIITNTATVSSDTSDPTTPNIASATSAVRPVADLSISKTATPDSVFAGHNILYTVVVTNNGPDAAVNVILTDSVPASTTFQSLASPSGWICTTPVVGGSGNIVCARPSLAAGASATFVIVVTVNSNTPVGTLVVNTATVSSDTGDLTAGASNTASATATVSLYRLYFPLIAHNYMAAPDLVVASILVSGNNVQVAIKNQGDLPVTQVPTHEFWVDLYVSPNPPPTRVNEVWNDGRSTQGIVWGVTMNALPALRPGGILTLTISDAYYQPDLSNFSPVTPGTPIYVQVDSANTQTNYGSVLENHEITGAPYNNISGTVATAMSSAESADQAPGASDRWPPSSNHLPPRPQ